MTFRPFLVADRPSALRIIRGATPDLSPSGLGIMTHANITDNVAGFIQNFPSSGGFYERNDAFEVDDESRYLTADGNYTPCGQRIRDRTTIICDSGAFQKEGATIRDYDTLFDRYDELGVDYGIINDVLNDPKATYEEATEAYAKYDPDQRSFALVGVAQGQSLKEYLGSYEQMRELGYDHIAVGGLLSKQGERSGKFAQVSDTEFMKSVLTRLRTEYPSDWLFALGCHHPLRHHFFEELDLFGADYKGWLFKYKAQLTDTLEARKWRFRELRSFLRQNIFRRRVGQPAPRLLILPEPDVVDQFAEETTAWERYCGGYLSSFAKWRRETPNSEDLVDIAFVSDTYGLVPGDFQLPSYSSETSNRIAGDFEAMLRADFANLLRYRKYDHILIAGGKAHREQCRPIKTLTQLDSDAETDIDEVSGRFGTQLQQLVQWLNAVEQDSGNFVVSAQAL